MITKFDNDNFEQLVINEGKPTLVDFWAEWCGPCKMIAPVVEELSKDYDSKAVIGKVNVDEQQALSERFGIRSIPTILFFKDGEIVDQVVGYVPKNELSKKLDKIV